MIGSIGADVLSQDDLSRHGEGVRNLITSLFVITVGLVQSKHMEMAQSQLLLPIVKIANMYDVLTFNPDT